MAKKMSVAALTEMKKRGERFLMLTAYDYTTARLASEAGVPIILVGDSMGMTTMGLDSTIGVTASDIIWACRAAKRGAGDALVVADMPFMATEPNAERAVMNAARLIQKGGADAVKLEGGANATERVRRIVDTGVPVMGHIGFQPQSIKRFGRYFVRGKGADEREALLEVASEIEAAGAFALVLELVEPSLAGEISRRLTIPTIGIGAGAETDAQVQVFHDFVGLTPAATRPKHALAQLELDADIKAAISKFRESLRQR